MNILSYPIRHSFAWGNSISEITVFHGCPGVKQIHKKLKHYIKTIQFLKVHVENQNEIHQNIHYSTSALNIASEEKNRSLLILLDYLYFSVFAYVLPLYYCMLSKISYVVQSI